MIHDPQKTCARCGSSSVMDWHDLDEEQKMLVERLPGSADHTLDERKRHRFCTRCWYEDISLPHDKA